MCPSTTATRPLPASYRRRRSPITFPEYRTGKRPPNYGLKFPAEVLTPDEVNRLINACPRRGPSGLRNRALIVLLWRSGLRCSEALSLYPKDVDADNGLLNVLRGKGGKRRAVGIDPMALAVLERWLEKRRQLGISTYAPLFCTIAHDELGGPGRPLRSAYVRSMFKRVGRRAGIAKRVHPHGLRHTHAFELAQEGVPVHQIQVQLGHSSLGVTDRYIRHLAPGEIVATIREREWPAAVDVSARNTAPPAPS